MKPGLFQEHLRYLKKNGYSSATLTETSRRLDALPPETVVITFDDGYEDNVLHSMPMLVQEGLKATFFVTSGFVGERPERPPRGTRLYGDRRMMSRSQLRELADAGMEIGSHTRSHVNVRGVLRDDPTRAMAELKGSREELEEILGRPVTSFAYPNGQQGVFSAATRELVKAAGFDCAVTTMWGALTPAADTLELPRIEVRQDDGVDVLAQKLSGRYDFMSLYCRRVDRSKRWGAEDPTPSDEKVAPAASER